MARSRNQAKAVVALLVVLGIKNAEVLVTETLITGGLRVLRHANVSPRLKPCRYIDPRLFFAFFFLSLFVWSNTYIYIHEQPRRQRLVWYVPNAAPSRNLEKSVAVVAVVLGSETAEVLITPIFITRGTRASRPANPGRGSSRRPSTDN